MTTTTMNDTIPALVKAVRPFANRSRRVAALHDALVRIDGGTTLVQATDMEIACTVAACTPDADPGVRLFDSANGERVTDRDPLNFPAVGRLAGETVATFVIGMASPYTGEAGYSQRVRVLWADGRTTLCCLKGMVPAYEDSRVLTGFREWTIR